MKNTFLKLMAVTLILMTAFVACDKNNDNNDDNSNNTNNPTNPTGEVGVKINGVTWATRNVDKPGTFTAKPEDAGMFYQWNRKIGWSSTDPMLNSNTDTIWDNSMSNSDSWESINDPCPSGWRVPTLSELQSLINFDGYWGELNGVDGYFFDNGNQKVFFPAAGNRSFDGSLLNVGILGSYWCRENSLDFPYYMGFVNIGIDVYFSASTDGRSVRCVKE